MAPLQRVYVNLLNWGTGVMWRKNFAVSLKKQLDVFELKVRILIYFYMFYFTCQFFNHLAGKLKKTFPAQFLFLIFMLKTTIFSLVLKIPFTIGSRVNYLFFSEAMSIKF